MKNKAPVAATVKSVSAAPATTETAEEKASKRVVIKFADAAKALFAAPTADCIGLLISHTPSDNTPAKQYTLKKSDLEAHPALILQLAMFGASVHLRNQINTEKDEGDARAALEARFEGFKAGIYRAQSEGTESVPLVMQALRLALVTSGGFTDEIVNEKVDRQMKKWHEADKAGKAQLRSNLMGNPEIKKAFTELSIKATKPVEQAIDLASL